MAKDVKETKKTEEPGVIPPVQKEKIIRISELNAELIKKMNEKQLQDYVAAMRTSANIFPALKEKLEAAFQAKNYPLVFQLLKSVRGRLVKIHADNLVKDFDKKINLSQELENIRHEKLDVVIHYLFSTLTMLFTDIQNFLEELEVGETAQKSKAHSGVIKEKLLAVTELDAHTIKQMTDNQLSGYLESLTAFHEDCNAQENGLRSAIKLKQYASVLRWLSAIEESLLKIHAKNLMEDCQNQIVQCKNINDIRHDKLEIFANYFLSSLSMLSADIKKLNLPALKQIIRHLLK
jgi:hypothetical protein